MGHEGFLRIQKGAVTKDNRFFVGKFYVHNNFLDAIIKIKGINWEDEDQISFFIEWWNNRGLALNLLNLIKIKKNDFWQWKEWKLK